LDNITHTLVGITLVRAGVGRRTPGATAAMVIASNAPDLDIISAITGGAVPYLAAHRGPTHGVLGVLGLALVSALIVWSVQRVRGKTESVASIGGLIGVALAGTALHVLMDLPTSYGVRLFSPFDTTWYALDWLPIVDVYLWVLLIGGTIAAQVRRGQRVFLARGALALCLLFYAGRGVAQHGRSTSRPRPAQTEQPRHVQQRPCCRDIQRWIGSAAAPRAPACRPPLPTFFSPFTWQLVRQQPDGYGSADLAAGARPSIRALLDSERPISGWSKHVARRRRACSSTSPGCRPPGR
jgi:membrane-bound metal-dependent hydrolase YbcI (DUF457 family)